MKNTHQSLGFTSLAIVCWIGLALSGCDDDGGGAEPADAGDVVLDGDEDGEEPQSDAGTSDILDGDLPDAPPTCIDDDLEPSSIPLPYEIEGSAVFDDLVLCPVDTDWYRIPVSSGERLDVEVSFDHSQRDLDVVLWNDRFEILDSSESGSDVERVVYGAVEDESVLFGVFSFNYVASTYNLAVAISPFGVGCSDDPEEPNETAQDAFAAESPFEIESRLCQVDSDWYQIDVPAGSTLSARLDLDHSFGDLQLRAFLDDALDDEPIGSSVSASDLERMMLGPFEADVDVFVEVYGREGAFNDYRLRLKTYEEPSAELTIEGRLDFEDRPIDAEGFTGEIVVQSAPHVRVELVREFDGVVIGEGETDQTGAFAVEAIVHAQEPYYVRALSALSFEGFRARVEDRSEQNAIYALAGEPFSIESSGGVNIELLASADGPTGGAFNILEASLRAFHFLAAYTEPVENILIYRWEPGRAHLCGSCYSRDVISLGGQLEDTDEYDDDIILHELGHYFQDHFSVDSSPGGSHDGDRTDPLLAYGEGMATFFSSLIQDDPEYVDTYIDSVRLRDLETALEDEDEYFGTTDETISGNVSEFLVASVMWDSVDPASDDEPFDGLSLDLDDLMTVFTETLTSSDRPEIGARGIDFADWLNAVTCVVPDASPHLVELSNDQREYPWDPEEHAVCAEKARLGLVGEIEWRNDGLWLNFPDSTTVGGRLDLDIAHGRRRDQLTTSCASWPCRLPVSVSGDLSIAVTGYSGETLVRGSWLGPIARERLLGRRRLGYSPLGAVREFGDF